MHTPRAFLSVLSWAPVLVWSRRRMPIRKWQNSVILQSAWELQAYEPFRVGSVVAGVGNGRLKRLKLWQNSPFLQSVFDLQSATGGELVGLKYNVRFGKHILKKSWQCCPPRHSELSLHMLMAARDLVAIVGCIRGLSTQVPKIAWQDWFRRQSSLLLQEGDVLVFFVSFILVLCVCLGKQILKTLWHSSRLRQSLWSWQCIVVFRDLWCELLPSDYWKERQISYRKCLQSCLHEISDQSERSPSPFSCGLPTQTVRTLSFFSLKWSA